MIAFNVTNFEIMSRMRDVFSVSSAQIRFLGVGAFRVRTNALANGFHKYDQKHEYNDQNDNSSDNRDEDDPPFVASRAVNEEETGERTVR